MIRCYVNNQVCYPDLKSEIKLTKENPYVKNSDSYTMDISFPMAIPENARCFGSVHRPDVSKRMGLLDDCLLYADNLLLIRGSGRVTEISESTVKLQIIGGKSNVKYKASFQKVFIDRISYPAVASKYIPSDIDEEYEEKAIWVDGEIAAQGYVGNKYQYVFQPIYDLTNDLIANHCCKYQGKEKTGQILTSAAVQPNLMMVLRCVLQHMGYKISSNVYDVAPWNELVIANARQTLNIAYALPHWTADKFINEFRNLFNASFIFDEARKTVRIVRNNEMDTANEVAYEVVEEFKTNYDESGVEYVGSSNLEYALDGGDRTLDEFPAEVRRNFEILDYPTYASMVRAWVSMGEKDKFTHIFHSPQGFFFHGHKYNDEGEDTGEYELQQFGVFGPLYRDLDVEDFLELKMYPVQMKYDIYNFFWYKWVEIHRSDFMWLWNFPPLSWMDKKDLKARQWMPCVNNDKGNEFIDYEEKGYVSVSNVLEDGDTATTEDEEDDTGIALMWVAEYAHETDGDTLTKVPASFTDFRNSYLSTTDKAWSMCLVDPSYNVHYMGELHSGSVQIKSTVDVNNEICYKFLMDGVPDPTRIYVFHNKRYLASRIEVKITNAGIDRLKTGYFYEIL